MHRINYLFNHANYAYAVFGKVGRTASLDVVIELVRTKCLPTMCYGIDIFHVDKFDMGSFQYVVDNCFRKILDVKSTETVRQCMMEFNWLAMCDLIDMRKRIFFKKKISLSGNSLCQVIVNTCMRNQR